MIEWTATRIDVANYCKMRYYLRYVKHEKPLNLPEYLKGIVFHKIIENFWNNLGTFEEVKKKRKKYFDAESFSEYAGRYWNKEVIVSEKTNRKIEWRDESERWIMYHNIKKASFSLFSKLIEEEKPLFSEINFKFSLEGIIFKGRIDEIRKEDNQIIIRDYKSGNPNIGIMKVNFDPQMTLYNLGFCSLCFSDEKFAEIFNLKEERKYFMGNPKFINSNIEHQFFMIENGNIYSAKRQDEHFYHLKNMIENLEKTIRTGEINPEWGRKCDYCDMKVACSQNLENISRNSKGYQQFFDFAVPNLQRSTFEEKKDNQKKINFKRKTSY